MNREILFKAKRKDNGEWVEGYYVFCRRRHYILPICGKCGFDEREDYWTEIDPSTICQCTGRNDEWEHDIFQCDDERYEIRFCEDSLTWEAVSVFSSESISLGEFNPSEYVRIGNAIDNPELLEVGE